MHKNWDDLRFVLAVAEAGSVSGAARRLGVNHATVLRRIADFEDRTGGHIFERSGQGYRVAAGREKVIEAAREVEAAVVGVGRALEGAEAFLSGVVRITSTDTFCTAVLPAILRDLRDAAPDLRFELHCTNAHLDLGRLHADISIRPAARLTEDLVGEQVGHLVMRPYRPAARHGADRWLGMGGALAKAPPVEWMARNGIEAGEGGIADSFVVLREMVAGGLGTSYLPVCLAEGFAGLDPAPDLAPDLTVPVWVASHADIAGVGRLRAVREVLVRMLRVSPQLSH